MRCFVLPAHSEPRLGACRILLLGERSEDPGLYAPAPKGSSLSLSSIKGGGIPKRDVRAMPAAPRAEAAAATAAAGAFGYHAVGLATATDPEKETRGIDATPSHTRDPTRCARTRKPLFKVSHGVRARILRVVAGMRIPLAVYSKGARNCCRRKRFPLLRTEIQNCSKTPNCVDRQ